MLRQRPQRPTKVAAQRPTKVMLSERTARLLWIVAVLDMMTIAWMIAAGDWLDQKTSGFAEAITLGGHHRLVLLLAAVGFAMLSGLAVATEGFTSAGRLEIALITIAGTISVAALAGALSAILLIAGTALLLGFVGWLLFRR